MIGENAEPVADRERKIETAKVEDKDVTKIAFDVHVGSPEGPLAHFALTLANGHIGQCEAEKMASDERRHRHAAPEVASRMEPPLGSIAGSCSIPDRDARYAIRRLARSPGAPSSPSSRSPGVGVNTRCAGDARCAAACGHPASLVDAFDRRRRRCPRHEFFPDFQDLRARNSVFSASSATAR
jgi:hypothetical protein